MRHNAAMPQCFDVSMPRHRNASMPPNAIICRRAGDGKKSARSAREKPAEKPAYKDSIPAPRQRLGTLTRPSGLTIR
jgi:hypothetical protein